jgi:hypothetical protein
MCGAEAMADIDTVKQTHEQQLMQVDGVEGVGIGVDDIGNPTIIVYVSSAGVQKLLPQQIEGFKLKVENLKGPITALPADR